MDELNPVFQNRNPLGKGFPANQSKSKSVPVRDSPARPRSQAAGGLTGSRDKSVQNEYIRNLQQQIYLLELETRYLRSGKPAQPQQLGSMSNLRGSRNLLASKASLHKSLSGSLHLPSQPNLIEEHEDLLELQKSRQDAEKLRDEQKKLEVDNSSVKKERDQLLNEIKGLKERHATEKDKIYGELISMKKKYESAQSETHRTEISYNRVLQEKERMEGVASEIKNEATRLKEQVDEQLQINASLKHRIDELLQSNTTLTTKLKNAESTISGFKIDEYTEHLAEVEKEKKQLLVQIKVVEQERQQIEAAKKKADEEIHELVKQSVEITLERDQVQQLLVKERGQKKKQKEDDEHERQAIEEQRNELLRLRDDYGMMKIGSDNKDRKITELQNQIKANEASYNKNVEAKIILTERISELETRLRTNELELIQVGQDKSLLLDDVAELKNQVDMLTRKQATLTSTNNQLTVDLERQKRDLKTLQNFTAVLDQVESNGLNYLEQMREMRKYLEVKESD